MVLRVVCVVEGNSWGSTKDQLEANVSAAPLTPAGVYVSAPLQETEGGRSREMERREEPVSTLHV